ncbi:hypothetical protein NBH00_10850 [Paraconexibacter antarcticus]|uniref:LVIVD repeat-containing protein n=1 Tax=Paraconexibacter antarcticus TaxID=2949664 RepID=A0ABY5DXC7_9ACTN|nr:hypothetical protein [Paraconexibacter antarcticus]UTI66683.1 hypothetical protein NBH00_10850 [Paraconexibacter antarcticus]
MSQKLMHGGGHHAQLPASPRRPVRAVLVLVTTTLLMLGVDVGTAAAQNGFAAGEFSGLPDGAMSAPVSPARVFEGPVAPATCGPGSSVENGLDGQVPLADRLDGRSSKGYSCNLKLVGQYQGEGSSWVSQSYGACAYMSTRWPDTEKSRGVQVLDVSDTAHPTLAGTLTSPAMLGPWESLKVNSQRGLLAAAFGGPIIGDGFVEIYDIRTDCRRPRLLGSISAVDLLRHFSGERSDVPTDLNAATLLGHEGNWSPDGNTYWVSSFVGGVVTAIDVRDPSAPRIVWTGSTGIINHGFSLSQDGNTLYMAQVGNLAETITGAPLGAFQGIEPNGLKIFDVTAIQSRAAHPTISPLGHAYWTDGGIGQMSIPISYGSHPYLVFVDELNEGGARIIDIADAQAPRVISKLKLQIQMPQNIDVARRDVGGTGPFTYDSHYCTVDRQQDPTTIACGYFDSGVRVFDIRDPSAPREVAYFNPPAQLGRNGELKGSEHAGGPGVIALTALFHGGDAAGHPQVGGALPILNTDWCSSPPAFVRDQLWVTCQDNGFMALKFTNGAYPIKPGCPNSVGPVSGAGIGPARLGKTRAATRRRFARDQVRSTKHTDTFCPGRAGIRIGYAPYRLVRTLGHRQRPSLAGTAVLITTADPRSAILGARPGAKVTGLTAALRHAVGVRHKDEVWYFVDRGRVTAVLRTRRGRVIEIGIANRPLTRSRAAARRFVATFG